MKITKSHIVQIIFYILIIGIVNNSRVYDENKTLLLEIEVEELLEELETKETFENSLKTQYNNSRNTLKYVKKVFLSNTNLRDVFSKPSYGYSKKTTNDHTCKSITKLALFILYCSLKLHL